MLHGQLSWLASERSEVAYASNSVDLVFWKQVDLARMIWSALSVHRLKRLHCLAAVSLIIIYNVSKIVWSSFFVVC